MSKNIRIGLGIFFITCGICVLIFASCHSDAERFLECCVCGIAASITLWGDKDEETE